jgi:hypothetical protein
MAFSFPTIPEIEIVIGGPKPKNPQVAKTSKPTEKKGSLLLSPAAKPLILLIRILLEILDILAIPYGSMLGKEFNFPMLWKVGTMLCIGAPFLFLAIEVYIAKLFLASGFHPDTIQLLTLILKLTFPTVVLLCGICMIVGGTRLQQGKSFVQKYGTELVPLPAFESGVKFMLGDVKLSLRDTHTGIGAFGGIGSGKMLGNYLKINALDTLSGLLVEKTVGEIEVGEAVETPWGPRKVLKLIKDTQEIVILTTASGKTADCCKYHLWEFKIEGEEENDYIAETQQLLAFINEGKTLLCPIWENQTLKYEKITEIRETKEKTDMTCFVLEGTEHKFALKNGIVTHNCLDPEQGILMYDGTIKKVKDVQKGEFLMGPDSKPRRIIQTSTGFGPLYKITPIKGAGKPWICNDAHILTLKYTNRNGSRPSKTKNTYKGISQVFGKNKTYTERLHQQKSLEENNYTADVCIKDFIQAKSPNQKLDAFWKMFRPNGIEFPNDQQENTHQTFTTEEFYLAGVKIENGDIRKESPLETRLLEFTNADKNIPHWALTAPREKRLALLAGIIDTEGTVNNETRCIDLTQKLKRIIEKTVWLCRSLGLSATEPYQSWKECTNRTKILPTLEEIYHTPRILENENLIERAILKINLHLKEKKINETKQTELLELCEKIQNWVKKPDCQLNEEITALLNIHESEPRELYWRTSICGDIEIIPTRVPYKQITEALSEKHADGRGITHIDERDTKDPLCFGWDAEPIGEGPFCGFTLDGDGRFLLDDFTVTHNTVSFMVPMMRQFFKQLRDDNPNSEFARCGALILDEKGDFIDSTITEMILAGRDLQDLIIIDPDLDLYRYNPLDPNQSADENAAKLARVQKILGSSSGGDNAYWDQTSQATIKFFLQLLEVYKPKNKIGLDDIARFMRDDDLATVLCDEVEQTLESKRTAKEITESDYGAYTDAISQCRNAWIQLNQNTKSTLKTTITNMLGPIASNPKLQKVFCRDTNFSFMDLPNKGKVVLFRGSGIDKPTARLICVCLKIDFQTWQKRRNGSAAERYGLNTMRTVVFICDEYQEFVTCGGEGDETFYGVSRSTRTAPIIATQSYNSLETAIKNKEQTKTLRQNIATWIFFRTTDQDTMELGALLAGEAKREDYSQSQNTTGLLESAANMGSGGRDSSSINISRKLEAVFRKDDFSKLITMTMEKSKKGPFYSEAIIYHYHDIDESAESRCYRTRLNHLYYDKDLRAQASKNVKSLDHILYDRNSQRKANTRGLLLIQAAILKGEEARKDSIVKKEAENKVESLSINPDEMDSMEKLKSAISSQQKHVTGTPEEKESELNPDDINAEIRRLEEERYGEHHKKLLSHSVLSRANTRHTEENDTKEIVTLSALPFEDDYEEGNNSLTEKIMPPDVVHNLAHGNSDMDEEEDEDDLWNVPIELQTQEIPITNPEIPLSVLTTPETLPDMESIWTLPEEEPPVIKEIPVVEDVQITKESQVEEIPQITEIPQVEEIPNISIEEPQQKETEDENPEITYGYETFPTEDEPTDSTPFENLASDEIIAPPDIPEENIDATETIIGEEDDDKK